MLKTVTIYEKANQFLLKVPDPDTAVSAPSVHVTHHCRAQGAAAALPADLPNSTGDECGRQAGQGSPCRHL